MTDINPFHYLTKKYEGGSPPVFLLALSGGADSMLALDLALEAGLGPRLQVIHFEHGLADHNGDASLLCTQVCEKEKVSLTTLGLPIKIWGKRMGWSLEMAGHHLRRKVLETMAQKVGACAIITGHQQDDLVETILLRLTRGTAPSGWPGHSGGLAVPREMPLKNLSRNQVREQARQRNLKTWEDPTNQDPDQPRAALRKRVLSNLNERQKTGIRRASDLMRQEEQEYRLWLRQFWKSSGPSRVLDLQALKSLPLPLARRALIYLATWALDGHSPSSGVVQRMMDDMATPGSTHSRALDLGGRLFAWREGSSMRFMDPAGYHPGLDLVALETAPGYLQLPNGQTLTLRVEGSKGVQGFEPILALPEEPIKWRTWQAGDRIRTGRSQAGKKLQDLFSSCRIPRSLRSLWPLLVNGDDMVLWVAGLAADQGLKGQLLDQPGTRGLWQGANHV